MSRRTHDTIRAEPLAPAHRATPVALAIRRRVALAIRRRVACSLRAVPVALLTTMVLLARAGVEGVRAQEPGADPGSTPLDYRDELLGHFEQSSRKMLLLSEAMPAETYDWSPGEDVFSVARVYAHIARYNYLYLTENLGIEAPADVDWRNLESLTDKTAVREALLASIEHGRGAVSELDEAELTQTVRLYGRDVPGWAVLSQLVAHMNEHVGQAIAYARMNGVVPPWSR